MAVLKEFMALDGTLTNLTDLIRSGVGYPLLLWGGSADPNSEKLRRIQGILQGHVSSSTSSVWGAVTASKMVRATLKGCPRWR